MQDVVEAVEARAAQGERVGLAVLVRTERSSPKTPGALMAFTERGEIIGSLTGGCIEPALYEEAKTVLAGAAPRIARFGIAHDDAFDGLSAVIAYCGDIGPPAERDDHMTRLMDELTRDSVCLHLIANMITPGAIAVL